MRLRRIMRIAAGNFNHNGLKHGFERETRLPRRSRRRNAASIKEGGNYGNEGNGALL